LGGDIKEDWAPCSLGRGAEKSPPVGSSGRAPVGDLGDKVPQQGPGAEPW